MLTNKSHKKTLLNSLSSALIIFIIIAGVFTALNFIPTAHAAIILKQTATNYCTNLTGPSSCTVTVGPLSAGDVIVLTTALELYMHGGTPPPPWVSTVYVPRPDSYTLLKENNVLNVNPNFETQVWLSTISSNYNFNNYTITVQTNSVGPNDGQNLQVTAFVLSGVSTNVPQSNIAVGPYASCQTCTTSTLVSIPSSGGYFAVLVTARESAAIYTAGTGFTSATPQGQTGFVEYSLSGLSGQTNFPFSMDQAYNGNSIGVIFTPPPLPSNSYGPVVVKQYGTTYCQIVGPSTCTLSGLGPLAAGDVIVLTVGVRTNTSYCCNDVVIVNSIGALDSFTMIRQVGNDLGLSQIWTAQITSAYNNNNYQISVPFTSANNPNKKTYSVQVTAYVVINIPPIPPSGNVQTIVGQGTYGNCYYRVASNTAVSLPSAYFAIMISTDPSGTFGSVDFWQTGYTQATPTGQYSVSIYSTSLQANSTDFTICNNPSTSPEALGAVFPATSYTTITNLATLTATLFATVTSVYSAYTLVTSTLIVTSTNIINQLISYPSPLTFQFWFWPVFMWILFVGLFVAFGRMANADGKAFIILIMLGLTFGSIVGTLMGVTPVIFIPIFSLLLVLALWKLH